MSEKKFYQDKEFKKLQMKWYKTLDDKGFDDVERIGKLRQKHYNEYDAILARSDSVIRSAMQKQNALLSFQHYSLIRNFSHANTAISTSGTKFKLLSTDKIILRLTGDGKTLRFISKYLRSRCKPPKTTTRPNQKPYSLFYVHSRLKKLINIMKTHTWKDGGGSKNPLNE